MERALAQLFDGIVQIINCVHFLLVGFSIIDSYVCCVTLSFILRDASNELPLIDHALVIIVLQYKHRPRRAT